MRFQPGLRALWHMDCIRVQVLKLEGAFVRRDSAKRLTCRIAICGAAALASVEFISGWLGLSRVGIDGAEWLVPLVAVAAIGVVAWGVLRTSRAGSEDDGKTACCPSCGRPVRADWRLCPNCGAFLDSASAAEPTR